MKLLPQILFVLGAVLGATAEIRAQSASSAAFGSTVPIWSVHVTVRERIDSGPNQRIEIWSRNWVVSPSGQVHADTAHYGFNAPDGNSGSNVPLNEVGRWAYWSMDGGALDSYVFGDGPSWSMWPNNPPNGAGYSGEGRRLTAFIDVQPPANSAPTIAWNAAPGAVASGQSYTVSAHGYDPDGNLTQVNVWKNGAPFSFAAGGDGTNADSGNVTSDPGPTVVTFTAQAVDSSGASSATISQTVTVSPPNNVPVAAISGSTSLAVNEVGSWSFSGSDPDGNLSRWRFYASTNGNPQWAPVSGSLVSGSYATSFATPGSYTWKVDVQDSTGASASASITVNVTAPVPVSASISASPASAFAPGSTNVSWSTSNATSVSVTGSGLSSAATSGSQAVNGLSAGTYTYTIVAQGPSGPVTRTATVTVSAPSNSAPTISWNSTPGTVASGQSYTVSAHGHDPDGNLSSVKILRSGGPYAASGGGSGWDSDSAATTSDSGPLTVTYTAEAVDAAGVRSATISQTVTIAAPPAVTGSLTASPSTGTTPGSATISWTTTNATAVVVSGPGVASGAVSGAQIVTGLGVGTHTFSLTAQGYGGPVIRTAQVTVTAAPNYTLTTAASGGGAVTPGGAYSAGSVVTVAATPDATHRFINWTGDASGAASTIAVTLDRAKFVQANFAAKSAQTITFNPPGDLGLGAPPLTLSASATSGLPVSFSLRSGSAVLNGNSLQVTGTGPVTIQADQPGDGFFLPAAPVSRSFNVTTAATLKYRGQSRTLLRDATPREAPPFVLEKP